MVEFVILGFLDHVTVLIGISVRGNAVAGVIHQPWYNFDKPGLPLGRCLWGVIGLGGYSVISIIHVSFVIKKLGLPKAIN